MSRFMDLITMNLIVLKLHENMFCLGLSIPSSKNKHSTIADTVYCFQYKLRMCSLQNHSMLSTRKYSSNESSVVLYAITVIVHEVYDSLPSRQSLY